MMIANGGERQQAYGAVNTSVGTHILAILVLSMRSDERQYMWPPRTAAPFVNINLKIVLCSSGKGNIGR